MCPSYKWPVLLRCSQETQWEVIVLEMIPCEISLISFLHSTNLNPERSPAFCDLCDFQAVLLPRCGRTSCVSCRRRHGDGCQQSSRKLYTVSHPAPPHPEEWYQARRMLQASLVQVGTSENLNRAEPGKYLAVLVVPCLCHCCTLWVLFASSGLNSHSDLGGPSSYMDPTLFKLHRAGGKAATWSKCCWLWIYPAFGLFSVGLNSGAILLLLKMLSFCMVW